MNKTMRTEEEIREKIKFLEQEINDNKDDKLYCVKLGCAVNHLKWVLNEDDNFS